MRTSTHRQLMGLIELNYNMLQNLIELIGEDLDIKDLQFSLKTCEWQIISHDEKPYLASEMVNSITEHDEIISKGKKFLKILNGAASVLYSNHREVTTGSLLTIDQNGNRSERVFLSSTVRSRSRLRGVLTVSGESLGITQPTRIDNWLELAIKNHSVNEVLYFFNELTWWNLYKIYEIIDCDLGGKRNVNRYYDKRKLNLFTQTCQSRKAIGDEARHATDKYPPPKEKLSLEEAHQMISGLFTNWIESKK